MVPKRRRNFLILAFMLVLLSGTCTGNSVVFGWNNGGYSSNPSNPDYGTHDWIAQHALDWLPQQEKQFILDNLMKYLYGTELPDNGGAPDGIGDTTKHHVYYFANGSLQEDDSAVRAKQEYDKAVSFYQNGNEAEATKTLGIMTHYIADVAVFGHVMGSKTNWGLEKHHSDYENYVNDRTTQYDSEFSAYLSFDGVLANISAYNATLTLAYDTTFDLNGEYTCIWMDQNYDWNNPAFKNNCGESLNLAVNLVADVLHMFYLEAELGVPEFTTSTVLPIIGVTLVFFTVLLVAVIYIKKRKN